MKKPSPTADRLRQYFDDTYKKVGVLEICYAGACRAGIKCTRRYYTTVFKSWYNDLCKKRSADVARHRELDDLRSKIASVMATNETLKMEFAGSREMIEQKRKEVELGLRDLAEARTKIKELEKQRDELTRFMSWMGEGVLSGDLSNFVNIFGKHEKK